MGEGHFWYLSWAFPNKPPIFTFLPLHLLPEASWGSGQSRLLCDATPSRMLTRGFKDQESSPLERKGRCGYVRLRGAERWKEEGEPSAEPALETRRGLRAKKRAHVQVTWPPTHPFSCVPITRGESGCARQGREVSQPQPLEVQSRLELPFLGSHYFQKVVCWEPVFRVSGHCSFPPPSSSFPLCVWGLYTLLPSCPLLACLFSCH